MYRKDNILGLGQINGGGSSYQLSWNNHYAIKQLLGKTDRDLKKMADCWVKTPAQKHITRVLTRWRHGFPRIDSNILGEIIRGSTRWRSNPMSQAMFGKHNVIKIQSEIKHVVRSSTRWENYTGNFAMINSTRWRKSVFMFILRYCTNYILSCMYVSCVGIHISLFRIKGDLAF